MSMTGTAAPGLFPNFAGAMDRVARRTLLHRLRSLSRGEIELEDAGESTRLGERGDLRVVLRVNDPRFFRTAVLGGNLSVAESYLRGDWDCNDLTSLFRIFIRNADVAKGLELGFARILGCWHRLYHWLRANSLSGSRRNIRAHYDLGNDFFRLWLDETLAYSCGIFNSSDATMYEASIVKFEQVCRKLDLRSADHVLEIGSGWGGFAIHAAASHGCRVTTSTISRGQFDLARERIEGAGLHDRVSLLECDYRELKGRFDKLVSIEMVEAVGHNNLDAYFRQCGELLAPEGSMLLQAIIMPERRYAQYLRSVDFIQRVCLPGRVPAVTVVDSRCGRPDVGPSAGRRGRLGSALRGDAATMASCVHGAARSGAPARLFARVRPAVELLPLLLRGGLRGAAHQRAPTPVRQAGVPARRNRPAS